MIRFSSLADYRFVSVYAYSRFHAFCGRSYKTTLAPLGLQPATSTFRNVVVTGEVLDQHFTFTTRRVKH